MLSQAENELLCRVGPGTLMGDLMRQYWVPACRSDELPEPDGAPLRVRLLGENLVAYRTTSGSVGLMQDACPHRGASMFFGRNEEDGLRCVYHGWKFDTTGACIDMPNEPAESNFKHKIKAAAYPIQERGGIAWAYLGPRQTPPPLPDIEANMLPEGTCRQTNLLRECNWVQALEGDLDTVHVAFLHGGHRRPEQSRPGSFAFYSASQRAARYSVVNMPYGVMYGAYRDAEADSDYWRIAHFLFPFYTMVPTGMLGVQKIARAWVPVDDEHTLYFHMTDPETRVEPGSRTPGERVNVGDAVIAEAEQLPNTSGWYGRFRAKAHAGNDYLIDREAQRSWRSYTGLRDITIQDQAVTESMGTIYKRWQERLGSSDSMIIRMRRRLLDAAKALRDHGTVPPGVDEPAVYRQRSGGVVLPKGADWVAASEPLRQAFVDHPELLK